MVMLILMKHLQKESSWVSTHWHGSGSRKGLKSSKFSASPQRYMSADWEIRMCYQYRAF